MNKWILSALLACAAGTVLAQTITLQPSGRCGAVPGYEEPLYELACRAGPISGIYPGAIVKEATTPDGHVLTATSDGVDWREPTGGTGGAGHPDRIVASTFNYSAESNQLQWATPEGQRGNTPLFEGVCSAVEGTPGAGKVLHYREAGSARKPICEWEVDDTASGGSGLDAAGVRDQVSSQIQAGDNITVTPSGSGATQRLTIATADPYDDAALTGRVDGLESFESAMKDTRELGTYSLNQIQPNQYIATGLKVPLAARDRMVRIVVDAEDPDLFLLSALLSKTRVTTPGTQASDANGVGIDIANGERLYFAVNNAGDLWAADDTTATSHSLAISLIEIALASTNREGLMSAEDKGKLDGVEDDATADQTAAEIKTAYESNSDTNAFTNADHTKLDGIEDNATADQTDAEIKTAYENNSDTNAFTDAEQTKVGRLPSAACTNNQIAKWSGTAWTCGTDATGGGDGLTTSDVDDRIKLPARAGNATDRFARTALPSDTLYHGPHVDSVLGAFLGTDASTNSTTIEVGGIFTAQPALATLRSVPDDVWVFSQEVGPRQTNVWAAIRAPSDQAAAITAGSRALDITESEIGVFERYPATQWVRIGTNVQGTFVYYAVEVADFPSGAMYLVREQHELDLDGALIDIIQWRRELGLGGIHFEEMYPGVNPNPTSSNQAAGSVALDTSPDTGTQAFDLDLPGGGTRTGTFHIQLDLKITNAHSSVSFTSGRTTQQITAADKVRVFSVAVDVADLLEESQFGVGRTTNGIYLWQVQAFAQTTPQGTYRLLLYRDDNNEVGFYRDWVGAAGSSNLTISAELRVTFTPDGPDPSLDDLGGLTQNEVDARVTAGTKPAARAGNTTTWTATEAPGRDTNLAQTRTATTMTISSSTGTNTLLPSATTTRAGVYPSADRNKLAAIESGATADQTAAEIKTAYESNANTNAFTDDDETKVGRLPSAACANNQILKSNGTAFTCQTDATASGGTGLDASGVRGETQAQLQAGTGISLTPSGSGATRQLTIANTITAFTGLSDTPGSLGTAGQVPAVNAAGTALEWSDRQGGTETMGQFTPSSTAANWGSVSNGSSPRTLTDPVPTDNRDSRRRHPG